LPFVQQVKGSCAWEQAFVGSSSMDGRTQPGCRCWHQPIFRQHRSMRGAASYLQHKATGRRSAVSHSCSTLSMRISCSQAQQPGGAHTGECSGQPGWSMGPGALPANDAQSARAAPGQQPQSAVDVPEQVSAREGPFGSLQDRVAATAGRFSRDAS
jgi:hypothetical protein